MANIQVVIGEDVFGFHPDMLMLESDRGLESILGFVPATADIYELQDFTLGSYKGLVWFEGLTKEPKVGYRAMLLVEGDIGLVDKQGPFFAYEESPYLEVCRSSPVRSVFRRW